MSDDDRAKHETRAILFAVRTFTSMEISRDEQSFEDRLSGGQVHVGGY